MHVAYLFLCIMVRLSGSYICLRAYLPIRVAWLSFNWPVLSQRLYEFFSVCWSICPPCFHLAVCFSVLWSVCLSILSAYNGFLSVYKYKSLSLCLFVTLFDCLSVCPYVSFFSPGPMFSGDFHKFSSHGEVRQSNSLLYLVESVWRGGGGVMIYWWRGSDTTTYIPVRMPRRPPSCDSLG